MKNKYITPVVIIEELSKKDVFCSSQPAAKPIHSGGYETEEDW